MWEGEVKDGVKWIEQVNWLVDEILWRGFIDCAYLLDEYIRNGKWIPTTCLNGGGLLCKVAFRWAIYNV